MRLFLLFCLVLVLVASATHANAASWGIGQNSEGDAVPPEPSTEATLKSSSLSSSSSTPSTPAGAATPSPASSGAGASTPASPESLKARKPAQAEVYGVLCLAFFVLNFFRGKRKNEQYAQQIANRLLPMLESQFSHLGPGPIVVDDGDENATENAAADNNSKKRRRQRPILLRESANEFVLWASGRRNLGDVGQGSGALLRLRLRGRMDAVSNILSVAEGVPDQLEVTLPLPRRANAGGRGGSGGSGGGSIGVPVALAVGRPAALREAIEDFEDLRRLARPVACNAAPARNLPWWPTSMISVDGSSSASASASGPASASGGGLAAVSDSTQALADLVASAPMGHALAASARASLASSSSRVVSSQPKPRLRILRLSGDGALRRGGAAGAPVLSAVFDLPAPGARDFDAAADDVVRLVAALLATADAVAAYGGGAGGSGTGGMKTMTTDARTKALALRAAAAAGDDGNSRSGGGPATATAAAAAASLEAKKREAEKQKLASMSNEAKEKYLLRKQRIEQKRMMKKRTLRI